MHILIATPEYAPLASTGPLGEHVARIATELAELGHEVSVTLPYYRSVAESSRPKPTGVSFSVQVGSQRFPCEILQATAVKGPNVFLIRRDEYFDRSGLYGVDGRDYQDNAERFIFFTKSLLELSKRLDPLPNVALSVDWQTALLPAFARDQKVPFRTALSIFDLHYQGNFWSYDFALTNLPGEYFSARGVEFYGSLNFLKGGILFADCVVFPSERWARESMVSGCGLEIVLREQAGKLKGIPLGLDQVFWSGKRDQKALLDVHELTPSPAGPVVCAFLGTGRDESLLLESLDRLLDADIRFVVAGPTQRKADWIYFLRKHRGKLVHLERLTPEQERVIYAGSDILLEPWPVDVDGIHVRRSAPFGVVPVALACFGLHAFVTDAGPVGEDGNGFVCFQPTADAFVDSVRRAMQSFEEKPLWKMLVERNRARDISWRATAGGYEKILAALSMRPAERAAA